MLPVKWRKLSNSLGKKKGFQKIWHELGKETYSANCSVDTWLGSKNIYTCKPVNIKFIYRNRKTLFFILASSRTLPHLIKNWTHGSFSCTLILKCWLETLLLVLTVMRRPHCTVSTYANLHAMSWITDFNGITHCTIFAGTCSQLCKKSELEKDLYFLFSHLHNIQVARLSSSL